MIFTFYYDTTYAGPPFPTVHVAIRNLNTDQTVEATAYIDSGADGTIVPRRLLDRIKARKVDEMTLRWGSGPRQRVDIFEILLQIGSYRALKVYAVGDQVEQRMIVGRDVLNQFVVTLDGLAGAVEISQ